VFAIAAETGWPEERILFMPLVRLAQYQHCLLRRNGTTTIWTATQLNSRSHQSLLAELRERWASTALEASTPPNKMPAARHHEK
jgi:hypothetical protein